MFGPVKLALAAIALAGVGGLVAGLAFGSDIPEPRIGDPVVLTPTPTPSAPPSAPPSSAPSSAPSSSPSTSPRQTPPSADDDNDGRPEADDDDIDEIERSPLPWGDTSGGSDDDGRDDGSDDGPDDGADDGDDD